MTMMVEMCTEDLHAETGKTFSHEIQNSSGAKTAFSHEIQNSGGATFSFIAMVALQSIPYFLKLHQLTLNEFEVNFSHFIISFTFFFRSRENNNDCIYIYLFSQTRSSSSRSPNYYF